jgi:hypothetical protein
MFKHGYLLLKWLPLLICSIAVVRLERAPLQRWNLRIASPEKTSGNGR